MVLNLGRGHGVHVFSLDPACGEFFLTRRAVAIPDKPQRIYSINEGNARTFSPGIKLFLEQCKAGDKPYSLRYTGSMVADVHRTLLYGGVFLYPASSSAPAGKLRLLYEVNPMSRIFEEAGGRAICGVARSPLDIVPTDLHQRSPVILGCKRDVDIVEALLGGEASA
jgi:fructose-1,6-bisphosphatase I